ncbi:conserved domain protein [Heliomicrobium modesticaldum Ice1]|uniref:Conserved domain protein n=1 Tax=Heliobacterium modesticaldum (strain ATCC 51547 / Ice1) TaxID=498761 RepID=B0TIG3_HELMI|nr:conserved domain protein [Heliomicrobium modesticaldum Ice1]
MQVERRAEVSAEALSGGRVSNAWITCLRVGDNSPKGLLIPHNVVRGHPRITKGAIRCQMGPRPIS